METMEKDQFGGIQLKRCTVMRIDQQRNTRTNESKIVNRDR